MYDLLWKSLGNRWTLVLFCIGMVVAAARVAVAKDPPQQAAQAGLVADRPASGPAVETPAGFMVPYTETIPGTKVSFEMIPVPGGEFTLGSPESEAERGTDEGPPVRVRVEPFWIGKSEVTWAEYKAFMAMYDLFKKLQRLAATPAESRSANSAEAWQLISDHAWDGNLEQGWSVDAVTSATPLYDSTFTYGVGEQPNQPAVTMTQFAARQYTKWLSGILGRDYRLPSEAEWEYAARAGTQTAYSFGEGAEALGDYAWYDANADYQLHPVASKKPNPWGLYDMHGNVGEWTLDGYDAATYQKLAPGPVDSAAAIQWPTKQFPRVIRGGSWLDPAPACRSAARHKSDDPEWKLSDPNIPRSPWWYTEEPAQGVGMRLVRPLHKMTVDQRKQAWEPDVEAVREDVDSRLKEGRGVLGIANPTLPAAVEAVKKLDQ